MKDFSEGFDNSPIPHLREIRRAPMRYRHILPLTIIKRYQCLVVGAARGKLTIAFASKRNMKVIESLSRYTGKAIFPVLVDPMRMQLLIQRIERCEHCTQSKFLKGYQAEGLKCCLHHLRRNEINAILILITSQRARGLR